MVLGFSLSGYEIVSHHYIAYKMLRTSLSVLLDNLNYSLVIFVSSMLVLYIFVWLFKIMKVDNESGIVKLEILTIALVLSYFAAEMILGVFVGCYVGAIEAKVFGYVQNLISGEISLAFCDRKKSFRIRPECYFHRRGFFNSKNIRFSFLASTSIPSKVTQIFGSCQ